MIKKTKEPTTRADSQNQDNYIPYSLELQVKGLIAVATSENPIRRKELVKKLNVEDRTIRLAIEVLRHNGERIIAHEKGGYYYAENERQYRQWRQSIISRIKRQSEMLKAMDGKVEGQEQWNISV